MVAAAVIGGAVIGAAGSAYAGSKSAGAAKDAQGLEGNEFNTITGQEQPFMNAGVGASNRLADLLGTSGNTGAQGYGSLTSNFTAQDYLNNQDPGYQFQLQTGAQATRNADTPGMGSLSGQSIKDLINFNQSTAATGYQNAFNRYQTQNTNTYNRLAGLATLGQNAASNTGQAGTNIVNSEGNAAMAAGNAQGNAAIGIGNAAGGAATTYAYLNAFGNNNSNTGASNYQTVTGDGAVDGGGGT